MKHAAQVIELSEEVSGDVRECRSNPGHISYISGMVSLGGRRGRRNSYRNNQNRSSHNGNRSNYSRNGYHGYNGNGNQRNNPNKQSNSQNNASLTNNQTNSSQPNDNRASHHSGPSRYNQRNGGTKNQNGQSKPQLSVKDRNEYLATGQCFNCGVTGHISQNCPTGTSMPSNHPNHPPGISTHNVEVEVDDYKYVGGLAETTEIGDEIPVTSIQLALLEVRSSSRHVHCPRRTCIDDFVAERAMYVLEQMRPYPNDDPLLVIEEDRFMVYQFEPDLYVIMDQEVCEDERINASLLLRADFNLPTWYAEKRASQHNNNLPENNQWAEGPLMGDSVQWGLMKTILEGIPEYPPCEDISKQRWEILPRSFGYTINDRASGILVPIMQEKLDDRSFDLITWYAKQCWQRHCTEEGIIPRERWYCPIGDVWGCPADRLLNNLQPYPGDESPDLMVHRFDVEYYSEAVGIMHDRL